MNKIILTSILLLISMNSLAGQTITIDKKKNTEILFEQNNLKIGNLLIDNLNVKEDNGFYIISGIGLENLNNNNNLKKYNILSKIKKENDMIYVQNLKMTPLGTDNEIDFNGKIKEEDLKNSKNIFELLKKTNNFNLKIHSKNKSSKILDMFNIKSIEDINKSDIIENLNLEKNDNYLKIKNIELSISNIIEFKFEGIIKINKDNYIIENGKLSYKFFELNEKSMNLMKYLKIQNKIRNISVNNETLTDFIKKL